MKQQTFEHKLIFYKDEYIKEIFIVNDEVINYSSKELLKSIKQDSWKGGQYIG